MHTFRLAFQNFPDTMKAARALQTAPDVEVLPEPTEHKLNVTIKRTDYASASAQLSALLPADVNCRYAS